MHVSHIILFPFSIEHNMTIQPIKFVEISKALYLLFLTHTRINIYIYFFIYIFIPY